MVFAYVDSLASMAIYVIFLGTFRKTLDIFGLSVEIKKVGVFFLVASGERVTCILVSRPFRSTVVEPVQIALARSM